MTASHGPIVVELDALPEDGPDTAPPVPEVEEVNTSLQSAMVYVAKPASRLARWFWAALVGLVGFVVSLAAYDYVTTLLAQSPILGLIVTGLIAVLGAVALIFAVRELLALSRLRKVDGIQAAARGALADGDYEQAKQAVARLTRMYRNHAPAQWGLARYNDLQGQLFDAEAVLTTAETNLLAPMDQAAIKQVEAASRQVAAVTALVPLALMDVIAALTMNLRMIRQIGEIYGGRSGTLGSWRLTRTVISHLVATGAMSVGDDLIGSFAGGGVLSKLSRRFGEGVVNGALTARVGVAAIEICRPLPFQAIKRPSVGGIMSRALSGLFKGAS